MSQLEKYINIVQEGKGGPPELKSSRNIKLTVGLQLSAKKIPPTSYIGNSFGLKSTKGMSLIPLNTAIAIITSVKDKIDEHLTNLGFSDPKAEDADKSDASSEDGVLISEKYILKWNDRSESFQVEKAIPSERYYALYLKK